jgi:hypothetical protein
MKGRKKVMTFSLQSFPIQNQTITPNFFFKNPKYYYRLNPKHVSLSNELQSQLQKLTHNLYNYTKIILDELIMKQKSKLKTLKILASEGKYLCLTF